MCGIAGILDYTQPVDPPVLDRFTDALVHRGPDGRGIWIDGPIGLGHRRLAILDPSPLGACPMAYVAPDGEVLRLTFNGEIYNFLELRELLRAEGYRFRTDTDTEVVAAAWHRWGADAMHRFNGMWAFALWREQTRTLVLARDRFGVKPLYMLATGARVAFASELKAFRALPWYTPQLDTDAAALFFRDPAAYDGVSMGTALAGVHRLPAGHTLTLGADGSASLDAWWDADAHVPAVPTTYDAQVTAFRALFLDAVRVRMRSDVPIGTSLSGGLDSSAVACGMAAFARAADGDAWGVAQLGDRAADVFARCASDARRTFIATFPGEAVDERSWADLVVAHTGASPAYWTFRGGAALRDLPASVWALDDLSAVPAVPVYNIYRLMRAHGVVVTLDGHGGDELLAGYTWHRDVPRAELNALLRRDFATTHLPSILRNYDGCSMANGVEVRSPFMDWRLVQFTHALPAECKYDGTVSKRILRDALVGVLPEAIRTRSSKLGFESPLVAWANGGLGPVLLAATRTDAWRSAPAVAEAAGVAAIVEARTKARAWTADDRVALALAWRLLSYVLWCEQFVGAGARITRMLGGTAPGTSTAVAA